MSQTAKPLQIAIDGPAGAGKSTVARRLADRLDFLYIDTGAMYRASTWLALQKGISLEDGPGIARLASSADIVLKPADETSEGKIRVFADGQEITRAIRTNKMSDQVALVAALKEVREILLERQRELAGRESSVIDGRDIGTVVMPQAGLKIFLTASPEERAHRRLKELEAQGERPDFKDLLAAIKKRDHLDSTRAVSPLAKAFDAVEINTDQMSIDQVVDTLEKLARQAMSDKCLT